jgi:catechol 2,3-dioxygenase
MHSHVQGGLVTQPEFKLHSELKLGPVCLRTKNQDAMLSFYERQLGLKVIRSDQGYTALGAGSTHEPILILHQDEKASSRPPNATGLYHYALLVPDRPSLAAAYLSLGNMGVVFDGYADHQVSEALYLSDPEGNGIEIYSDRPKSDWKFDDGGVEITTQPLDLDSLLKELPREGRGLQAIADGTGVGHVHLKVSDLQASVTFYRDALGFELMRYWGSAAFLSAGRYHHHVGMNTWESVGGPPAQKTWVGLEYFVLEISQSDLNELSARLGENPQAQSDGSEQLFVSDPDDINLVFRAS